MKLLTTEQMVRRVFCKGCHPCDMCQISRCTKADWKHLARAARKFCRIEKAQKEREYDNAPKCKAFICHGPGHQSKTHCQLKGNHKIHEAVYGCDDQLARWKGERVFSGYFDEPPTEPKGAT